MSSIPPSLPAFHQLMVPTIQALQSLGGSASIAELVDQIAKLLQLPDKVMNYRRENASRNEVAYRAAWARTYLRAYGAIERTARGVWTLTPRASEVTEDAIPAIIKAVRAPKTSTNLPDHPDLEDTTGPIEPESNEVDQEIAWRTQLLDAVRQMQPAGFERLCQRILRESGFVKVEVTGRSGDGGIDGIGVLRMQLISFQVLFQCKRYWDVVGPSAIRDFRGAMVGRSDKALFITTGRFTAEGRREATRDGAPTVELIDGEALCDLLKDLRIGVSTQMIETVKVHPEMFSGI